MCTSEINKEASDNTYRNMRVVHMNVFVMLKALSQMQTLKCVQRCVCL